MKILVDMFACQTPSRFRGIGRYSLSLVNAMAKLRQINEMVILADALYPESFEELRQTFIRLLPAGAFLPYYHEPLQNPAWSSTGPLSKVAETLIEHAYQVVEPDVVLTPSLFDGWGGWEQGMVPLPDKHFANPKRAVILYDIIPYIFHHHYLDPDPPIQKWYLERAGMLRKFDLLLAISESTRQDVINLLGIDPDRVVNISGAASAQFRKFELSAGEKRNFLDRFGISRPFVLYIGGNEFRKNMDGALRAFALLPKRVRAGHQLFLNDVGDEAVFRNKAHALGLADADLVIARRTTDEELTTLYNLCKLFIFPSLYEGFGLPILEAMSCGAPVLASNNSSLPEVVGRADALFDASNDQAVADKICQVLMDDTFRTELAVYGEKRAKQFSWEKSARIAWEALESLQKEKKSLMHRNPSVSTTQRMRIAYVSPLPPQKSGISEYSRSLLPYLKPYFDIDLFTEPGLEVSDVFLKENFAILPWTELPERSGDYEVVIYHMGNSEFHIPIHRLLQEVPGIVVSHDFYMSNLPFVSEMKFGERGIFLHEMDYSHGLRGVVDYVKNGIESTRWTWPLNWRVLKYAREVIVHSQHQKDLLEEFYGYGWQPNLKVIKHLRESAPLITNSQKRALRKKLGIPPSAFVFCSFGFMAPTKLNNTTIQAFSRILPKVRDDTMLVFVGDLEGGEYGQETLQILEELKLKKKVRITGFVSNKEYERYLACADVAIQLRKDSRGETSGAALECMAHGLPVIMNAYGSLNDYDPEAVVKLPGIPGIEEIAGAMIHLQTDESFRKEKGRRARALIIEQHDPEKVAAAYAEVIANAAQNREQKLFAPLLDSILELGAPATLQQSSAIYAAANLALRCQPRILVDVSSLEGVTVQDDEHKEIIEFVKGLFSSSDRSIHVELVYEEDERLWRAGRFAEKIFELPGQSLGSDIPIQPGDILLVSSHLLAKTVPSSGICEQIRQRGGKIITLAYEASENLLEMPALESDMFICGSQNCARDIFASLTAFPMTLKRPLDILFPSPDETTPRNDSTKVHAGFRMEAGERTGLARMVKILTPGKLEGCGWMQALIESGFVFTYGSDWSVGEDLSKHENRLGSY